MPAMNQWIDKACYLMLRKYLCVHGLVDIANGGFVFLGVFDDISKYVVVATILGAEGDLVKEVVCKNNLK